VVEVPNIDVNRVWETVIAVLLAAAGGFARLLNMKNKRRMRGGRILSELFVSSFAGLMVLLLARTGGLSGDWIGLVSGVAGWVGPRMMDLILKPAGKMLGIEPEEAKDE